ncbi:MAG: hypothetical protein ACI4WT_00335 [Oligosphaeraceae bacterium]
MRELLERIRREWEISSLVTLLVALLLGGLLVALLSDGPRRGAAAPGLGGWEAEPLVTEQGLAFTRDGDADSTAAPAAPGLFGLPDDLCRMLAPTPKPRPRPRPAPAPKPVAPAPAPAPTVTEAPAPVVAPTPKPAPEAPKPQRVVVGTLYFAELQELSNGTQVALLELQRGDERQTVTLARGETRHGLTLLQTTDEAIQLQDARRRRLVLRREKELRLWVTED